MPSRSRTAPCAVCLFRAPCLCADLPRVRPRLRIQILRHAAELTKQSNTARWAALALGITPVDYAATRAPFDESQLDLDGACLLFPATNTLSGPMPAPAPPPALPPPAPRTLIVPDGTWQQARRMISRLPALAKLPRLSLHAAPAATRLRRPLEPHGMSTLEAIASALALLGEPAPANELRALLASVITRIERLRGRPLHQ
ncbi:MAG: DTW domain-containing protein [Deltaproteobacteria bacterium]|nr:DTW domain-containing protein [Deltaproteobacteria bacterium]